MENTLKLLKTLELIMNLNDAFVLTLWENRLSLHFKIERGIIKAHLNIFKKYVILQEQPLKVSRFRDDKPGIGVKNTSFFEMQFDVDGIELDITYSN
jgi:hypothetical protein